MFFCLEAVSQPRWNSELRACQPAGQSSLRGHSDSWAEWARKGSASPTWGPNPSPVTPSGLHSRIGWEPFAWSGPVVHMLNQFPGRFLFRLSLDSSTAPGGVSGKAAIERGASEDNGNDCCGEELICSAPHMGPCWNLRLRGRGS